MSNIAQYTVRGPREWAAQLDALIPIVRDSSPYGAALGPVTRSTVLRVVVEAGLRAMGAPAGAAVAELDPRQAALFDAPADETAP